LTWTTRRWNGGSRAAETLARVPQPNCGGWPCLIDLTVIRAVGAEDGEATDGLGYLPFEQRSAHLFFQPEPRRYERASLLITANQVVTQWGAVFGDVCWRRRFSTGSCSTATL
jgi:IstB-like ATP binding protein